MLLGDFIKELKHSSTWTIIYFDNGENDLMDLLLFEGTLGVLKNNIHYQEKWSKYKILEVEPMYGEDFKVEISFTICDNVMKF